VIFRRTAIERTSDFSAGADINRAALNEQLDILTAMIADAKDSIDRSPTIPDWDVIDYAFTLPDSATRANKYLAFGPNGEMVASSGTTSSIIASAYGETFIAKNTAAEALLFLGVTSTAAELNILDGVTATAAELNILDGVTATAAELNILDGVTATTAELNFVDGVTSNIQTQLNAKAALDSPTLTGTPTAPTATTGTNTTQLATTAFVNAEIANDVAVRLAYVSANQTITSGGLLTLAHSLGQVPKSVFLELICNTAEANFAINDVVMIGVNNTATSANRHSSVYYDATNVYVRFSSTAGVFTTGDKNTGAAIVLTNTSWRLRVRAFA
jgi:hypothetical protein